MPTIQDVARRAGVAPITVSRVINDSGYVREETRERVESAIAELGYVPNSLARGLRIKQTKTIGLILTDVTNPFWTTVARGVEDAASHAGFSVFLCNSDESEAKQMRYLNTLLQKQVDGVLVVPAGDAPGSVEIARQQGTAMVVLDRRVPNSQVDIVRCDSESGAFQVVSHLIGLGHHRIALLSGPMTVSTAKDRLAGYRRALTAAGLTIEDKLIDYGRFVNDSGYEMTRHVLQLSPRPTALFAANNLIAMGALRALSEAGLDVPDDMSLVSVDDVPATLTAHPFLTVAVQPGYEMGKRGAEVLLARLSGQDSGEFQEIVLPVQFVIRSSTGPPPEGTR
jgi:LacI family transcriptional regulator, galactose operon repressor